jgi:hypothetical protein
MHTNTIYTNNVCTTRLHLANLILQRQKGFKIVFCHLIETEKSVLTFLVTDSLNVEYNSHKFYSQNRCSVKCSGTSLLLQTNEKIGNMLVCSPLFLGKTFFFTNTE